ncbi:transglutaminase domain-containing protein, partial [Pseudoxanthomonas sp. SGD-10]
MKKRLLFLIVQLLYIIPLWAQINPKVPDNVGNVLILAGKNREELAEVISHYSSKPNDSLKLKAAYFLIGNMDTHYSRDYYWKDSLGNRISYRELDYDSLEEANKAFKDISLKYGKLSPVSFTYKDIDTIKADFLIDNIERAFSAWRGKELTDASTFKLFCEYVLPYRITTEPLQSWRDTYLKRFSWVADSLNHNISNDAINNTARILYKLFVNTFGFEEKKKPLPRYGAMQLFQLQKGACEDIADFKVFALRSQGIPATVENIPYWATSSGKHFFTGININGPQFTAAEASDLEREPAK